VLQKCNALNVKFSIRVAHIEDLDDAMNKATKMEEITLEIDANPKIILGKVQRQIDTLNISDQGASTSRKVEDQRAQNTGDKSWKMDTQRSNS